MDRKKSTPEAKLKLKAAKKKDGRSGKNISIIYSEILLKSPTILSKKMNNSLLNIKREQFSEELVKRDETYNRSSCAILNNWSFYSTSKLYKIKLLIDPLASSKNQTFKRSWGHFILDDIFNLRWLHYMDANKTAGEEARRQLHKNAACNLKQVLAATPHKTPTVRPPAPYHENYSS